MPSGLLPAMEYKGELYVESADIMQLLEEEFPEYTPLLPPEGSPERERAEDLMVLERRLFGDWLRWLTSSWCYSFSGGLAKPVLLWCRPKQLPRYCSLVKITLIESNVKYGLDCLRALAGIMRKARATLLHAWTRLTQSSEERKANTSLDQASP